jgi:predicted branched-subunit amino acid permease
MRKLGFAVAGSLVLTGLAALIWLPQSDMSRAVDTQGLHLIGVLFIFLPVAAVVGLILGLVVEWLTRDQGAGGGG